jgi:hypothetical protein
MKCYKSTCKCSRRQNQVLEFLLLGKQFWLSSLSVPCSVHLNVGDLLQKAFLHLIMQCLSLHLHLQRYLQPLLSSAAVERCSKL